MNYQTVRIARHDENLVDRKKWHIVLMPDFMAGGYYPSQKLNQPLETQIKSNIFFFLAKNYLIDAFCGGLGASLGKIFTAMGCLVCLSAILSRGWGGGHPC